MVIVMVNCMMMMNGVKTMVGVVTMTIDHANWAIKLYASNTLEKSRYHK